jgi:hypothetical protein
MNGPKKQNDPFSDDTPKQVRKYHWERWSRCKPSFLKVNRRYRLGIGPLPWVAVLEHCGVAAGYRVKSSGAILMCCPFHADTDPNLVLDIVEWPPAIRRNRFMCFACGASGDAIDFIMQLRPARDVPHLKQIITRLADLGG